MSNIAFELHHQDILAILGNPHRLWDAQHITGRAFIQEGMGAYYIETITHATHCYLNKKNLTSVLTACLPKPVYFVIGESLSNGIPGSLSWPQNCPPSCIFKYEFDSPRWLRHVIELGVVRY